MFSHLYNIVKTLTVCGDKIKLFQIKSNYITRFGVQELISIADWPAKEVGVSVNGLFSSVVTMLMLIYILQLNGII